MTTVSQPMSKKALITIGGKEVSLERQEHISSEQMTTESFISVRPAAMPTKKQRQRAPYLLIVLVAAILVILAAILAPQLAAQR